jgi:hypothetical protein
MDVAIVAAVIGAIATLAAAVLPKIVEKIQQRRQEAAHRSVTVRRIQDPADPDVFRALTLYERRMPPSERDDLEDIVRWLREVQEESRRGVCELEDYFLVAHAGGDLAGFAYLHLYPAARLAFFSYLVIDEGVPEARYCRVSTALVREARRNIERSGCCRGIVAEVQDAARVRHFKVLARMAGCPLNVVSIDYRQPRLSLTASDVTEVRMTLMYAPLDPDREPRRLHRTDVADILGFLATSIYGDHFEHRSDLDKAYRAYLQEWKARLVGTLPAVVELS